MLYKRKWHRDYYRQSHPKLIENCLFCGVPLSSFQKKACASPDCKKEMERLYLKSDGHILTLKKYMEKNSERIKMQRIRYREKDPDRYSDKIKRGNRKLQIKRKVEAGIAKALIEIGLASRPSGILNYHTSNHLIASAAIELGLINLGGTK